MHAAIYPPGSRDRPGRRVLGRIVARRFKAPDVVLFLLIHSLARNGRGTRRPGCVTFNQVILIFGSCYICSTAARAETERAEGGLDQTIPGNSIVGVLIPPPSPGSPLPIFSAYTSNPHC